MDDLEHRFRKLFQACHEESPSIGTIRRLVNAYAVKAKNGDGRIPLHLACRGSAVQLFEILVEQWLGSLKVKNENG